MTPCCIRFLLIGLIATGNAFHLNRPALAARPSSPSLTSLSMAEEKMPQINAIANIARMKAMAAQLKAGMQRRTLSTLRARMHA